MSTKAITGEVQMSYLYWAAPRQNELSGKSEYGVELIINKSDTKTIDALKAAMKAAVEAKWPDGKFPKNLRNPLKDGDTETRADGTPLPDIYKGKMFLRVKSSDKPGVVDANGQDILAASDFVSGDYGRASVNCFAYSQAGNNGLSFWLNNLQKLRDGEPLGGKTSAAADFGHVGGTPFN